MSCTFPALLPWGRGSYGSTGTCLGPDPPEHSPHTPKTRGCPAAMPLAPLPSMPRGETPMPWPLGTALPSPTKQVLSFTFGCCWGCKRSPAGAQPHSKSLQPHCRPLYCLLWAGCRQTDTPVPVPPQPPQVVRGHHVCPGVRGLASPTHHVLSRACCFSFSSRFRLSTSTFSSMFYGAGRRWVGCPHACLDPPAPLPTGMKQKWHGGPPPHGRALGAPVSEWHRRYFNPSAPGWGVPTDRKSVV